MFKIQKNSEAEGVVSVRVSGKISEEDFETFNRHIDKKIDEHSEIKILFDFKNFNEEEDNSMWEVMKFDSKHSNNISKIAVVGNEKLKMRVTKLKKMLISAETKYFDREDRTAALKWLQNR